MDKGGNDTKFVNAIFAAMGVPVTAEGLTKFFDSIAKMLPAESEEIKRIRKFYATEGKDYMDPSKPNYIPGMENYNIVYGNPLDPDSGLQGAFKDRMDTIANTLGNSSYMSKYGLDRGLTPQEIQSIIDGTYMGPVTPLTKRYKNLNDVATSEFNFTDNGVDTTNKDNTVDFKDPPDFGDDPEGEFGTGPSSNVPPGIVEDTPGGGEFTTPPKQDNTPPGIKEDRPGSGEFSSPGRSDIGSRVSDSYREDKDFGLL